MRENPIPGMNPWLEAFWCDVHTNLTNRARDQLNQHLPTGLRARIEEYVAAIKTSDSGNTNAIRHGFLVGRGLIHAVPLTTLGPFGYRPAADEISHQALASGWLD
ncbi:MAG: DUF4058 family protein [Planctomycetota bacterium]|nr:DUF4058 family protein [Planctomycetota bacterium]